VVTGEAYDVDVVANFMQSTTVKTFCKSVNICHTYERMCSGTSSY